MSPHEPSYPWDNRARKRGETDGSSWLTWPTNSVYSFSSQKQEEEKGQTNWICYSAGWCCRYQDYAPVGNRDRKEKRNQTTQKQEKEEEQAGSSRASSWEASIVSFNGKPRPAQEGAGDADRAGRVDNGKWNLKPPDDQGVALSKRWVFRLYL